VSIALSVLEDILTASPLTVCTAAIPFRVLSDVRKTKIRGRGGIGGGVPEALGPAGPVGIELVDPFIGTGPRCIIRRGVMRGRRRMRDVVICCTRNRCHK
jgi:hypothetical protein